MNPGQGKKSILRNSVGYMTGQVGLMLLSLLTFPLFTRVLSKSDYGLLSLTNVTLSMAGLVLGLGLPNAVVRFAPEYAKDASGEAYLRFNTSILTGSSALAALGTVVLLVISIWSPLPQQFQALSKTFQIVAVVVVARAAMNIFLEFFRIARNVQGYNLLCLSQKIVNVACSISGYFVFRTLNGLLLGLAVGEVLAACVGLVWSKRLAYWRWISIDWRGFWSCLSFAAPMMLSSICASLMNTGDRYFIEGYRGSAEVAGYAVAYDMCLYIQTLFISSFRLGALPEIVSRYTETGDEQAGRLLAKAFQYISWLLIGVGFGAVAVGKEALTLLASSKYTDSSRFLPWLVPGTLLGGLSFLFACGLYLKKRNDIWFWITAGSTALNVALNVLLIPSMGAKGAAISTLVTYAFQAGVIIIVSGRLLHVPFEVRSLARTVSCGIVMFLLVRNFSVGSAWWTTISLKVTTGVAVYGILLIILERQARQVFWNLCARRTLAN